MKKGEKIIYNLFGKYRLTAEHDESCIVMTEGQRIWMLQDWQESGKTYNPPLSIEMTTDEFFQINKVTGYAKIA